MLSADHISLNYFLENQIQAYMFPNPLTGSYFGIYGVCDGENGSLNKIPVPDLIILQDSVEIKEDIKKTLIEQYKNYSILDEEGNILFNLYLNNNSNKSLIILSALQNQDFKYIISRD